MDRKTITIVFSVVAAVLLLASLKMPVWQMRMEAPQYQDEEALDVKVYPNALLGDMDELKVLNSYIGVHVPDRLPQTRWLPIVLAGGGIAGLGCAFLPPRLRKRALFLVPTVVAVAILIAAVQAQWQMHQIGTKRDEKTTLVGVKDFTPPLIGRAKVAQFTITSFLSWGALAIGAALVLQWAGAWLSRKPANRASGTSNPEPPSNLMGDLAPNPR